MNTTWNDESTSDLQKQYLKLLKRAWRRQGSNAFHGWSYAEKYRNLRDKADYKWIDIELKDRDWHYKALADIKKILTSRGVRYE